MWWLGFLFGVIGYWIVGIIVLSLLAKLDTITITSHTLQNDRYKVFLSLVVWWLILLCVIFKRVPSMLSAAMSFVMTRVFKIQEQNNTENNNEIPMTSVLPNYMVNNNSSVTTPLSSGTTTSASTEGKKPKKQKKEKPVEKDGSERFKLMDLD